MPSRNNPADKQLLTPAELAEIMRVHPQVLQRWATAGKIRYTRTLGGHRRYFLEDVLVWQAGGEPEGWIFTWKNDEHQETLRENINSTNRKLAAKRAGSASAD